MDFIRAYVTARCDARIGMSMRCGGQRATIEECSKARVPRPSASRPRPRPPADEDLDARRDHGVRVLSARQMRPCLHFCGGHRDRARLGTAKRSSLYPIAQGGETAPQLTSTAADLLSPHSRLPHERANCDCGTTFCCPASIGPTLVGCHQGFLACRNHRSPFTHLSTTSRLKAIAQPCLPRTTKTK